MGRMFRQIRYEDLDNSVIYIKLKEHLINITPIVSNICVKKAHLILQLIKYIVEIHNLNYQDIVNGNIDELCDLIKEELKDFCSTSLIRTIKEFKLYEAFKYVAFEPYEIPVYRSRVLYNHLDVQNKRYLLHVNRDFPYIPLSCIDLFHPHLKHKFSKYHSSFLNYYVYDKITKIERNYYSQYDDFDILNYEELLFINRRKNYVDVRELINGIPLLNRTRFIYEITNYKDISNMSSNKMELLHMIKSITIDSDKAYISISRHSRNEESINIKDVTYIPTGQSLDDILSSNDNIPNVSINVNKDDIIKHNYRVGISTYENNEEKDRIIDIIDRNAAITKRIDELNKLISYKIDELIVR